MAAHLKSALDRRARQRYEVGAALTVTIGRHKIPAFTRDLSNRGVYFYLDQADSALINGDFDFLVELPPEVTLSTVCLVRCHGRAKRTEKVSGQMTGIAAEILQYSIDGEPTA